MFLAKNNCGFKDIKGNKYRFLVLVVFISGFMQIRFCGTHAEYDKIENIKNL
ncbi:MAG: type II toxin-antitoxin system HigB family toxin [Bacteroidales bacterium]|nr:type II toxin-antitoxin system HigB family toxin [Bacteroidales bacterium]